MADKKGAPSIATAQTMTGMKHAAKQEPCQHALGMLYAGLTLRRASWHDKCLSHLFLTGGMRVA